MQGLGFLEHGVEGPMNMTGLSDQKGGLLNPFHVNNGTAPETVPVRLCYTVYLFVMQLLRKN